MKNKIPQWIAIILLLIMLGSMAFTVSTAQAAKEKKWKDYYGKIITVIDIDPVVSGSGTGLVIHLDCEGWVWVWGKDWEGNWPKIGSVGRLYNSGDFWKFEPEKIEFEKKSKIVIPKEVIQIVKIESEWIKADKKIPEADNLVVVRFDDDKTSTGYVNNYKEWKLDINRDSYNGGKTFHNIAEWKDAGL